MSDKTSFTLALTNATPKLREKSPSIPLTTRKETMILPLSTMTIGDIEAALKLWSETEGVGLNESDTFERLATFLDRNPGLSVIVRDGQKTVAAILCGHDGRRGYLHHLAVDPEYRRQGLGNRIVEHCLLKLKELDIVKCNIFVYAYNEAGQQFWKRHGWEARQDLLVMQRVLQ